MQLPHIQLSTLFLAFFFTGLLHAADVVPPEVQLPGTQPGEVSSLESPNKCDNCHSGYNNATTAAAGQGEPQDEPATGWRGAAMGNAGRDPIFWATMAIAEQVFDGSGDLCIRCHSTGGWYAGRSTPTDGSGLLAGDSDGVDCDTCHSMTNTDDSEHIGVMNSPFIANCSSDASVPDKSCSTDTEGFYGSGMLSLWPDGQKLGPYSDTQAKHKVLPSAFHRDVDFCGTCHDVSNSIVGDLAPGNGTQPGAPHVVSSQDLYAGSPNLGGPVNEKAAFNNPPYTYGIVERTFSEYKASAFPVTRVSAFNNLPDDLKTKDGSIEVTYQAALAAGTGGDYADGTARYFSCQSCHMRPTTSAGAKQNGVPIRTDLPRHDHTGGNYWLTDVIKYQDSRGLLRLGGGLSDVQITALDLARTRAAKHLTQAATLIVDANILKVVNLTGHKLISGYPEGRRMWLNIKWYDQNDKLLREDGAYGPLVDSTNNPVMVANPVGGANIQVESILNLDDPNTRIYEAHYAMTKEWADTLLAVGQPADLPLAYDRTTGDVDFTLANLAALSAGKYHETFHFALNNHVAKDNRIPPYRMSYDEAKKRNVLPVPQTQYGNPASGGYYNYWDQVDLNALKPADAVSAQIQLLYQGTSWEYIQFLEKSNKGIDPAQGGNAFLGMEGINMLETWINAEISVAMEVAGDHKMVPPVVMTSTTWTYTSIKADQTISDFIATPSDTVFGATSILSATASSGLTVVFGSSTTAVCTVNGSVVTYLTRGDCTVTADQPGNDNYNPAPQVTLTSSVGKASQTITDFSANPATGTSGGTSTLSASASSGLTVVFGSSTAAICTVSGDTVTYVAKGDCRVTADQAGDNNYNPAPQATITIPVNKISQTISNFSADPTDGVFGASSNLSASASSGLAVSFGSNTITVCTVNGNTVTYLAAGSCIVTADQTGDDKYQPAPQVTLTISVGKVSQTITDFSANPATGTSGGTSTLSASASSGLAVVFGSSTAAICTVSGDTVTYVAKGDCRVTADQAGDNNYNPAPQATITIPVNKISQTISNFSADPATGIVDGTSTLSATASSGLAVSFGSNTITVCTVSGNTVTYLTAGSCIVTADQLGNANYNPAAQVTLTINVGKASQTITDFSANPATGTSGGTSTLSASASSGLTVVFGSSTAAICTVSGNAVSYVAAGTCTVTADQTGNDHYLKAERVNLNIPVNPQPPVNWMLSVEVSGNNGKVTSEPAGITDCVSVCDASFADGSEVTLTAESDTDWITVSQVWSSNCSGVENSCVLTMNNDKQADIAFHCVSMDIPKTTNPDSEWQCDTLKAASGFEIRGEQMKVTFSAKNGIQLGGGFIVGDGASFSAVTGSVTVQ